MENYLGITLARISKIRKTKLGQSIPNRIRSIQAIRFAIYRTQVFEDDPSGSCKKHNARDKVTHQIEGTIEIPLKEPIEALADTYIQLVNTTVAEALKKYDSLRHAPEEKYG